MFISRFVSYFKMRSLLSGICYNRVQLYLAGQQLQNVTVIRNGHLNLHINPVELLGDELNRQLCKTCITSKQHL